MLVVKDHPFIEKYNPENYQPEVYDFLSDFSDTEINALLKCQEQQGLEEALLLTSFTVNKKYSFKKRSEGESALNPEAIKHQQQLDCYGFSIATSQILETIGIDHKIAFANTHSFIIAKKNENIFIVDSVLPNITGKLSPENICHKDCLDNNIFSLNMLNHAQQNYKIPHLNTFLRNNYWIRFSKNTNRYGSSDREDILPNKNPCLIVRTYNYKEGARVLYGFYEFKVSTENDQLSRGYYLSKVLKHSYPEIDIRNRPLTAEKLVQKLGQLGLRTMAVNVIDNISTGLRQTNTISPIIWKAMQYNNLGKILGIDLSQDAIDILAAQLEDNTLNPNQKRILNGKIMKLKKSQK